MGVTVGMDNMGHYMTQRPRKFLEGFQEKILEKLVRGILDVTNAKSPGVHDTKGASGFALCL
jgi:hypothetical protein